ncbi:hypothetical protein K456DRAFT_56205 [Colletotrichum gloeosporioides 23]|nr:hypothetical protein K456DRAFT_56205 [Colletotrichum gloeosporioides 23]
MIIVLVLAVVVVVVVVAILTDVLKPGSARIAKLIDLSQVSSISHSSLACVTIPATSYACW